MQAEAKANRSQQRRALLDQVATLEAYDPAAVAEAVRKSRTDAQYAAARFATAQGQGAAFKAQVQQLRSAVKQLQCGNNGLAQQVCGMLSLCSCAIHTMMHALHMPAPCT